MEWLLGTQAHKEVLQLHEKVSRDLRGQPRDGPSQEAGGSLSRSTKAALQSEQHMSQDPPQQGEGHSRLPHPLTKLTAGDLGRFELALCRLTTTTTSPILRITRLSLELPFLFLTPSWTEQFPISQLCSKTGTYPKSNLNYLIFAKPAHLELARDRAPACDLEVATIGMGGCAAGERGAGQGAGVTHSPL